MKFEADYPYVCPSLETSLEEESKIEQEEFEKLYPEFAKIAKDEGFDDIAQSFEEVAKVEKSHSEILKFLTKNYKNNTLYKSRMKKVFKCSNCGHLECETEGWKKCPLCSLEQGYIAIDFSEILQKCAGCN